MIVAALGAVGVSVTTALAQPPVSGQADPHHHPDSARRRRGLRDAQGERGTDAAPRPAFRHRQPPGRELHLGAAACAKAPADGYNICG